jgi:hypothetical protein
MTKKAKKSERAKSATGSVDYDDSDEADEDWTEDEKSPEPAAAQAQVETKQLEPECGEPQSQPAHNDLSPTASYNEWIGKGPEAQPPDHPDPEPEPKKGKKED